MQAMKKRGENICFRKGLDDDTRKFMRELGFLNVTDDFWRDKGLIRFLDEGFNWADSVTGQSGGNTAKDTKAGYGKEKRQ